MGAVQVAGSSPDGVTAQCLELLTKLVRGLGKSFRKMQTVAASRFVVLPGSTDLVMWYWSKVAETAQAGEDLITGKPLTRIERHVHLLLFTTESSLVPYPVPLVIQGMAIFKDSLSQWSPKKKEDAMDADQHVGMAGCFMRSTVFGVDQNRQLQRLFPSQWSPMQCRC